MDSLKESIAFLCVPPRTSVVDAVVGELQFKASVFPCEPLRPLWLMLWLLLLCVVETSFVD